LPCVFQGRLGVPTTHLVRWVADCLFWRTLFRGPGLLLAEKWTRRDLNPRPPRCKRGALPTELRARTGVRTRERLVRLHETVFDMKIR
jgi:hypothetical protein